ncbi:carbohydrate ABC transporter permease [Solihabitans fulvus]|uniref:Carbohydrate ABC transporter permease n=1 Tax=Solihabitans fulvus TaxID=1892852 RepID=A0A5B2WHK4_9PSEU|nr:carbohydrate ABC transporter permease [Solihabitans fulvus]KAA2250132.1 carbohydrate ABC transporter permease [Solihabitans fulvus]
MNIRAQRPGRIVLRYLLLLAVLAISIGPFLWQLSTSLKGVGEDIYSYPPQFVPSEPTARNYARVADVVPVWGFALNSLLVAVANVAANCVGAALAGYALARMRFFGRKFVVLAFVLALLVPGESIMISLFLMMRSMQLSNTLLAVVLPGAVSALNVLLMRNAFAGLSYAVEEASLIDGANAWQRFTRIALPSVKGTIAVVAIFSFMFSWDDFLWPLIVLHDPDKYTLTIGLNYLQGTFASDQRLIAAGTIIAVAPLILMFLALQKYFFRGVGAGAVKG